MTTKVKMTKAQYKVADAIWSLTQVYGYPPSVAEIAEEVDRSPSGVQCQIENLITTGKVTRKPGKIRTLSLTREGYEELFDL